MTAQDNEGSVIELLFGDVLTESEVEDFQRTVTISGATAEALNSYLEKIVGTYGLHSAQFAEIAGKWELAAAKYAERMQDFGRAPAGAASMFQQAQINYALA